MRSLLFSIALLASAAPAFAQDAVVDTHVHLHNGEASIAEYRAQLKASGQSVDAFGAMWFGGPNQAIVGNPDDIKVCNDALIALAAKHPGMVAIATVHPYVLIASDFPQISLAKTLEAFAKLDLTDEERAKIRSGNARKLLGR